MQKVIIFSLFLFLSFSTLLAQNEEKTPQSRTISLTDYGIKPGNSKSLGYKLFKVIEKINGNRDKNKNITIEFAPGVYHFYPSQKIQREYYISNHDQDNPKFVGIALENTQNITIDGKGSQFVFHGVMLPLSILNTQNCTIKNLSIDFENPHIFQIEIVENNGTAGMAFRPAEWVKYRITQDSIFEAYGEGWTARPISGIAFEKDTRHIVYNSSDLSYSTKGIYKLKKDKYADKGEILYAPNWRDEKKTLLPGTIVAMRTWERPTPGVFV